MATIIPIHEIRSQTYINQPIYDPHKPIHQSTPSGDISTLSGKEATTDSLRTIFQEIEEDIPKDFRVRHQSTDETLDASSEEEEEEEEEEEDEEAGEEEEDEEEEEGEEEQEEEEEIEPLPPQPCRHRVEVTYQERLARCRALHLCCQMMHNPHQGLLLSPPKDTTTKKTKKSGGTSPQGCYTGKDILHNLYLKHCGLVTLSRAGVCDSIPSLKLYRSSGFYPFEFADAFICAGALSVVQPLWTTNDDQGLSTILLMWKMYDLLLDVAHHERPLAAALRAAQKWLRGLTCEAIRDEVTRMRIPQDVRVGLNESLWQVASKLNQGEKITIQGLDKNPGLLPLKPFTSPYYWSAFRANGACAGIHRPDLAEVSDDDDDDEVPPSKKKTRWEDSGIRADRDRRDGGACEKVHKLAKQMDKGLDHLEDKVKAKVKSVQEAVGGGGAQPDPVMDYEGRKKEMEEIFAMADAAPSRKEEVEKKLPGVFSEKEAEEKRHGGGGKKRWRGPGSGSCGRRH